MGVLSSNGVFAVICTGRLSAERLNEFFNMTYKKASMFGEVPLLVLISSVGDLTSAKKQLEPTQAPVSPDFNSHFVGRSLDIVVKEIGPAVDSSPLVEPTFFAILDGQSIKEDSALIVQYEDGKMDSARVHFDTVNVELVRVSTNGFLAETKSIAAKSEHGIYRVEPPKRPEDNQGSGTRKQLAPPAEQE